MTATIHLGFEIGTGNPIAVPIAHMAVTGQTQASGKTTTLEALVSRSGATALTFVTKRGEASFAEGRRVQPYFRDRADWQFVDSLLTAQLQEKNKFLRPWIMKICRATKTLAEVQARVRAALATAKGINEGVYTQLDAYLDLIVPEIERADLADTLDLAPGLNVMDVSAFATSMQMLFVQSAIDWVNEQSRKTIIVVPEAWEFIPEGKGSPVKASAVTLVRKGAGIGNFIWVDSQDMAGVDKTILRGCTVWLIGVQREANEIKRNLSNVPAGIRRPKTEDIALLEKGQFFACFEKTVAKVYVQPSWLDDDTARAVALGNQTVQSAIAQQPKEADVKESEARELRSRNEELAADVKRLQSELEAARVRTASADTLTIEEERARGYRRAMDAVRSAIEQASGAFVMLREIADSPLSESKTASAPLILDARDAPAAMDEPFVAPPQEDVPAQKQVRARAPADPNAVPSSAGKLLAALARMATMPRDSIRWETVCIIAGVLHGNGYFYAGRRYLIEKGFALEDGETTGITRAGLKQAGGSGQPIKRSDVIAMWRGRVKQHAGAMLDAIANHGAHWISTADLARATAMKPGNGHWYSGIKAIRDPGLIEQDGQRFRLSEFVRGLP